MKKSQERNMCVENLFHIPSKNYREVSNTLHLKTIPYFGIYSNSYVLLQTVSTLKINDKPKNFPSHLNKRIQKFQENFGNVQIEYFHLVLSGDIINELYRDSVLNQGFLRINIAPHPYIFYNCNIEKEHRTDIYISVFDSATAMNSIKSSNERDGVLINPNNFVEDGTRRMIILHPSDNSIPALSPNNCSIMINFASQTIHFYLVVVGTFQNKIVRCFVGEILIFPSFYGNKIFYPLTLGLEKKEYDDNTIKNIFISLRLYIDSFSSVIDFYSNLIRTSKFSLNEIKKELIKAFQIIFQVDDKNLTQKFAEFYYQNFLTFISDLFQNNSNNFSEELISSLYEDNKNYILELVWKYRNFHLILIKKIYNSLLASFGVDDKGILEELYLNSYKENIWINQENHICDRIVIEKDDFEENIACFRTRKIAEYTTLKLLENMLETIKKNEKEQFYDYFGFLDEPTKNKIFYETWVEKGKPFNVHSQFGEVSFLHKDGIDSHYYCTNDEKIKILRTVLEKYKNLYNYNKDESI